jgi:hypothetical protein
VLAIVVHSDDVGMVQARGCAGLMLKSPAHVGLGDEGGIEEFDRDWPAEAVIPAVAHFSHTTATQDAAQLVPASEHLGALHAASVAVDRR